MLVHVTWSRNQTGYKYPVLNHNFDELAPVHLLNYPRRNSYTQLSPKFLKKFFSSLPPSELKCSISHLPHLRKNQRLFRLQNCLSRKSSKFWTCSETFSPAILSYLQIIIFMEIFKDFFACTVVLTTNHENHGTIQRLLLSKMVLAANHQYPEKNSKSFSPAKLS